MTDEKTALTITGEQLIGKGIRMGADYIDTTMKSGAKKLIERPSTWINILAGIGGLVVYTQARTMSPGMRNAALIVGSNILAEKVPDYVMELMPTTPTTGGTRLGFAQITPIRVGAVTPVTGTEQLF